MSYGKKATAQIVLLMAGAAISQESRNLMTWNFVTLNCMIS